MVHCSNSKLICWVQKQLPPLQDTDKKRNMSFLIFLFVPMPYILIIPHLHQCISPSLSCHLHNTSQSCSRTSNQAALSFPTLLKFNDALVRSPSARLLPLFLTMGETYLETVGCVSKWWQFVATIGVHGSRSGSKMKRVERNFLFFFFFDKYSKVMLRTH